MSTLPHPISKTGSDNNALKRVPKIILHNLAIINGIWNKVIFQNVGTWNKKWGKFMEAEELWLWQEWMKRTIK